MIDFDGSRIHYSIDANSFFHEWILFFIKINHKYYLVARVEGADRKSFFAVAESNSPVDGFRFWDYPIEMQETDIPDTNMYDMLCICFYRNIVLTQA